MDDLSVRRRKPKSGSATPNAHGDDDTIRSKSSAKIDRGFTLAVFFVSGALAIAALAYVFLARSSQSVVVIDAGSTGSRVLAFTFQRNMLGQLTLVDELWHQVKPGLSSYADDASAGAKSIQTLIDMAKGRIDPDKWAQTPITLKATAGLRLLPKDKADMIINEVEKTLRTSGFKPEEKLIEIMDPTEEGLYGWFTVNFLTERIGSKETFVTLDLGGGSIQITMDPENPLEGLAGRKKKFLHEVTLEKGSSPQEIYSHSYLGLGLNAARMEIFANGNNPTGDGVIELTTPCYTSEKPLKWNYQGKEYLIKMKDASFENCIKIVNQVINKANVHMPKELLKREIAAFSYFFDKANERRFIESQATEGVIKVANYLYEAQQACQAYSNSEFYCVDLTFISSLLTKGFGFPVEKELRLFKKINGHEVSWAMGLAYNILQG